MYYRLRTGLSIYQDAVGDLHCMFPATGTVKHIRCSEDLIALLKVMQTPQTLDHLYRMAFAADPSLRPEAIALVLDRLIAEGVITRSADEVEVPRSSFELFLQEVAPLGAEQGIRAIQSGTAIIIGVGTVGSIVATLLAQSQVGHLVVVDSDCVEERNLERQLTYSRNDIFQDKVAILRQFITDRTNVRMTTHKNKVENATDVFNILENVEPPAVVINCGDEPSVDMIASWIDEAIQRRNVPLPFIAGGGYAGHLGSVGPTFIEGKTICWNCYQAQIHNIRYKYGLPDWHLIAHRPFPTHQRPAFAPLGLLVASLIATEALGILSGTISPLFVNRHAEWNLMRNEFLWHPLEPQPGCLRCALVSSRTVGEPR
ncbi:UBA/THIF-type NAD/FAD binding protein [Sulfobacillus acidophilus TPY]|uniref:UBA/THIF-type NAD/FAD binding protein n=1 Tax=Sulfobacillus acidophilus (strain ATCC 700253 / DSM 10332 / NAL) TaxID=679936 RepID=G8TZV4_SULAD|nr:UBA/THIF-type NAD/FAD binding protein [Sulfobacillus acidophilus TPY]AEW04123.1 UBA/THIF-type NAD/FAD binding protein [Sulfobacillus acidophilus DSM 10332]